MTQRKLERLLHDRETLLREMNHRVKNNLIMITSLINLKENEYNGNLELSDLRRQIDAVRFVHESLYKSEDITYINFKEYISNIVEAAFSPVRGTVHIDIHIDIEYIHFSIALPVGLLINELAANAMKHGYREGKEMTFTVNVQIEKDNNFCVMRVSNTGAPFPENIYLDNPATLGMRLLSALVEQLYGTIELQRTPQPLFTVRFPLDVT